MARSRRSKQNIERAWDRVQLFLWLVDYLISKGFVPDRLSRYPHSNPPYKVQQWRHWRHPEVELWLRGWVERKDFPRVEVHEFPFRIGVCLHRVVSGTHPSFVTAGEDPHVFMDWFHETVMARFGPSLAPGSRGDWWSSLQPRPAPTVLPVARRTMPPPAPGLTRPQRPRRLSDLVFWESCLTEDVPTHCFLDRVRRRARSLSLCQ
jgi:hypothetical protein